MSAGPLFTREILITPRLWQHYALRAGYVAMLAVLIYTAGQVTFGWQPPRTVGDMARFGRFVFQVLCSVQLALVLATSLLFCAGRVAQEKDRRTLVLLLMTDLRNSELVLGKLLSGLLPVFVLIGVSLPVFMALRLLGGISVAQVLWFEVLCVTVAFVSGSWGVLVAFWREKTFQTLATTVLGAVLALGLIEGLLLILSGESVWGRGVTILSPFEALRRIMNPLADSVSEQLAQTCLPTVAGLAGLGTLLTVVSSVGVRRWNPTRSIHAQVQAEQRAETIRKSARPVWEYPVAWREIQTRAYGRRMVFIKLAYIVFAGLLLFSLRGGTDALLMMGVIPSQGFALVLVSLVSLILINAQSVTALTSERDGQTLELLLVTEVTAPEFIFGKLGGVLYNTKELIAVPILATYWYRWTGLLEAEPAVFIIIGFVTLVLFAAMLGLHMGLGYDVSRSAILNSLGTLFFLFVGVFVLLVLILEARASFALQITPFLVFILGGSLGLWVSLTPKNPSPALMLSAVGLPFLTFFAVSSFLLGHTGDVLTAILAGYGFPTIAMLIPAISSNDFDAALGRATLDQQ